MKHRTGFQGDFVGNPVSGFFQPFDSDSLEMVFESLSDAVAVLEFPGAMVLWANSKARQAGMAEGERLNLSQTPTTGFKRLAIGIGGRTRYFEAALFPCSKPVKSDPSSNFFLILSGRQRSRERDIVSRVTRYCFEDVIGESPAIKNCLRLCRKAAAGDLTVLLTGESGTGKELFAQSIHSGSSRRPGPFVAINCGAIPRDLIESELFGHERGAFTGAFAARPGRFELASVGTIFLDEIGEMPLAMQVRLLRVLQERELTRVGGQKPMKVDIRVVAATNRDLADLVSEGRFRQDLYFRLKVFHVVIPPLRERREDIADLARRFLDRISPSGGPAGFSEKFLKALGAYEWPGNVRELENVIEVEASLCEGKVISHFPDYLTLKSCAICVIPGLGSPESGPIPSEADPFGGTATLSDIERAAFERIFRQNGGRQSVVCATLGISRATFYRKIKELGLK